MTFFQYYPKEKHISMLTIKSIQAVPSGVTRSFPKAEPVTLSLTASNYLAGAPWKLECGVRTVQFSCSVMSDFL